MFFAKTDNGYILRVRLTPNSSSCRFLGIVTGTGDETYLRVSVRAVPEKGKANLELTNFLAKTLNIARSSVEVTSGATGHWKKIKINTTKNLDEQLNHLMGE